MFVVHSGEEKLHFPSDFIFLGKMSLPLSKIFQSFLFVCVSDKQTLFPMPKMTSIFLFSFFLSTSVTQDLETQPIDALISITNYTY